jgi:hypothetical protein
VTENLKRALDFLFGCWHLNLSRPFTLSGWTYEVCLNCGKKLAYDRADIVCNVPQHNEKENALGSEVLDEDYTRVSVLQG